MDKNNNNSIPSFEMYDNNLIPLLPLILPLIPLLPLILSYSSSCYYY